jgi:hypothetical protein
MVPIHRRAQRVHVEHPILPRRALARRPRALATQPRVRSFALHRAASSLDVRLARRRRRRRRRRARLIASARVVAVPAPSRVAHPRRRDAPRAKTVAFSRVASFASSFVPSSSSSSSSSSSRTNA